MTEVEQKYLYESLGNQIKILRNKSGISQHDLAKNLNLSRASVVNIEKGRQHPSLHLLIDLTRIFNIQITDLLDISSITNFQNDSLRSIKTKIKESSKNKDDQEKVLEFIKKHIT